MPRMIRFGHDPSKFPPQAHLNIVDYRGRIVECYPGTMLPDAEVLEPPTQDIVDAGFAEFEGVDDGGAGNIYAFQRDLAALCAKYGILRGDPRTFSLDDMLAATRAVKATDDADIAAFETARDAPVEVVEAEGIPVDAGAPEIVTP